MSVWVDILKLCATGDMQAAHDVLTEQLLPALCRFGASDSGGRIYQGPLPKAVKKFISRLPLEQQVIGRTVDYELVDYILDAVFNGVERTLSLLEHCRAFSGSTLDELTESFPWKRGLKRSFKDKRKWIADNLRSMLNAGVSLPPLIINVLGTEGEPNKDFNEHAYCLSKRQLNQCWDDFRDEQGLLAEFRSLVGDDNERGAASEGSDYFSISISKIVSDPASTDEDKETLIDIQLVGRELGQELLSLLEEMHEAKRTDGYKPIAWHNVFWDICSDYMRLKLDLVLEMREPLCEGGDELASHIAQNYSEVVGTSRPAIVKRRIKLRDSCEEKIIEFTREKSAARSEQMSAGITHVIKED